MIPGEYFLSDEPIIANVKKTTDSDFLMVLLHLLLFVSSIFLARG